MNKLFFLLAILLSISCKNEVEKPTIEKQNSGIQVVEKSKIDTIEISKTHKINKIVCDLDGDNKNEIIEICRSTINKKSGLRIIFGNGKRTDYLGFGNEILKQGFNEFDWAGIFENIDKGTICWNNIDEEGTILTDEEIKDVDKIKLKNDAIFLHEAESCGGGIIYFENGIYHWIQQE